MDGNRRGIRSADDGGVSSLSDRGLCQVAAVIPAAGGGRRMGADRSKALLILAGQPVLVHAVAPMIGSGWLDVIVVVAGAHELEEVMALLAAGFPLPVETAVVPGGKERSDSVYAGLQWLASWAGWRPDARHFVAIHDAARPLVTPEVWERVLLAALCHGAAVPGIPVADTLKRVDKTGKIEATVDRECLWQAQTPQVFLFEEILAAYRDTRRHGRPGTDDAQVWESTGLSVQVVEGDRGNFKLTTPADMVLAEALLRLRGSRMPQ